MGMFAEAWAAIGAFLELGGPVLYAILAVAALMWTLILERLWYFFAALPKEAQDALDEWAARPGAGHGPVLAGPQGWRAMNLRRALLCRVRQGARRNLALIQTLMQVLPLLGLLGTVWGMVQVFHVMTVFGTGNARMMASGVSQATVPTMSGLVAALSGLYLAFWLRQRAAQEMRRLEGALSLEPAPQGPGEARP